MIATIPFSGLYESQHDYRFVREIENICDTTGTGEANQNLLEHVYSKINIRGSERLYAEDYAKTFCEKFGIKAEFESMQSPREYNFSTDIIYVTISEEEVERLFDEIPAEVLDEVCKDAFTPRSGFIPFYSADFRTWGSPDAWDHNQVGVLIEAYALYKDPDADFDEMMDYTEENGCISNWLFEAEPELFKRVDKIAYYLRRRSER